MRNCLKEITVGLRSDLAGKYMGYHWSLSFNALDWTDHGSCLFGVCEEQPRDRVMVVSCRVSQLSIYLLRIHSRIIAGRPAESFKIGLDQRFLATEVDWMVFQ